MMFRSTRGPTNGGWRLRTLLLLTLAFSATTKAVEVASLFTAQVAYDESERNARPKAYKNALAEVLLRVSGPRLVNDGAMFNSLFPDPAAYVVGFRPGEDDTLWVSFDGTAVEETLRQAGQTVWGADRPLTLVWLAVDWGQGTREIIAADGDESRQPSRSANRQRRLRQRILDHADRRGLPVAFPLLDSEDLANVEFSDIWGGFNERIVAASQRYAVNSILIGRVRAASAAQNRWTYLFAGEERSWTGEPEVVITQISDMLASEFAIEGNAPMRAVSLHVSGIESVEAYGSVQRMLSNLSLVEDFAVIEVTGDRISFRVNAHGGATRLARALRFEGLVEQERVDFGDYATGQPLTSLDFFYDR